MNIIIALCWYITSYFIIICRIWWCNYHLTITVFVFIVITLVLAYMTTSITDMLLSIPLPLLPSLWLSLCYLCFSFFLSASLVSLCYIPFLILFISFNSFSLCFFFYILLLVGQSLSHSLSLLVTLCYYLISFDVIDDIIWYNM